MSRRSSDARRIVFSAFASASRSYDPLFLSKSRVTPSAVTLYPDCFTTTRNGGLSGGASLLDAEDESAWLGLTSIRGIVVQTEVISRKEISTERRSMNGI